MQLRDFEIISQVGKGNFSTVYKVRRIVDNTFYAMKKVKIAQMSSKERQNALNQARILASISHPNIIAYKEAFVDEGSDSLYIIMEYAEGGDLSRRISAHIEGETIFPEDQIWSMLIQALRALKILHSLRVLHRDLKSANVYYTKGGIVKIGDMNISKVLKSQKTMAQTRTGSPYYASPEIWNNQNYNKKSDIWSLGCVLYEMMTLKAPFRSQNTQKLYSKIVRCSYSRVPNTYSKSLAGILDKTLQSTPELRLTAENLLSLKTVKARFRCVPLAESQLHKSSLLDTIQGSKQFETISHNLPKPRYHKKYNSNTAEQSKEQSLPLKRLDASLNVSTINDERRSIVLRFANKVRQSSLRPQEQTAPRGFHLPKIKAQNTRAPLPSARQSHSLRTKGIYDILRNKYV